MDCASSEKVLIWGTLQLLSDAYIYKWEGSAHLLLFYTTIHHHHQVHHC